MVDGRSTVRHGIFQSQKRSFTTSRFLPKKPSTLPEPKCCETSGVYGLCINDMDNDNGVDNNGVDADDAAAAAASTDDIVEEGEDDENEESDDNEGGEIEDGENEDGEIEDGENEDDEEDDDDDEVGYMEEPWREAVESGNVQQLKDLVQVHGLGVLKQNYMGEGGNYAETTALLTAARDDHLDMVQFLLEQCRSVVDVDAVDYSDADHETWNALHIAAGNGNVEMVHYLIRQGFDVNARTNHGDGSTALCVATRAGHDDVFRCLVETDGCNIDAAANEDGDSVLLVAIEKRNLAMVQCLMEYYEKAGNVERYRKESQFALYKVCAVRDGSLEIVKYLVESCHVDLEGTLDDDNELRDNTKGTPLLRAGESGNLYMIRYLEGCGTNIKATDKDGNTVLHRSVGRLDVIQHFVEEHSMNVEQSNHKGETVLHHCHYAFALETLQYLISTCNANVNATNADSETLLHIVSRIGFLSTAQCVLESGRVANVNAQDRNGQTPLHISCANRYDDVFEMVRFWVDTAGVNVYIPDKDGKTALHFAATVATEAAATVTAAKAAAATATATATAATTAAATTATRRSAVVEAATWRSKLVVKEATTTWRKRYRTVMFLVTSIPIVSDDGDEKAVAMDRAEGPSLSKRPKL